MKRLLTLTDKYLKCDNKLAKVVASVSYGTVS